MGRDDPHDWMWAGAVEMLARAERMHDQLFQPRRASGAPAWSPPVDVIETEDQLLILIALPGVRQTRTFFVMKEVVDNAPLDF